MRVALALTGCTNVDEINGEILERNGTQATF